MRSVTQEIDVRIDTCGTIMVIVGMTPAGRKWIETNCQAESWQWQGGMLNVDVRYGSDLITAMMDDGLIVA